MVTTIMLVVAMVDDHDGDYDDNHDNYDRNGHNNDDGHGDDKFEIF